jgi:hypothetical protein
MTDAETTLRSAILDGVASSAQDHGFRAGPESDALVDAVDRAITDPGIRWALRELEGDA